MLDNTPVLIGAGQFTFRGAALEAPTPLQMLEIVATSAARDAGLASLAGLDAIGVVGSAIDAEGALSELPVPRLANAPEALAARLGAAPRWGAVTEMGGNASQYLINTIAERIAAGEADFALAIGVEYLGSLMKKLRANASFEGYGDDGAEPAPRIGDPRPGTSPYETAHGMGLPVNTYPMFENALRARDHRSLEDHMRRMGELMAPFTRVAAANPYAWFPVERTAEELVTVTPDNRMVSYPYPKYLNAIMQVDQAAGVIITSVRKARELGVAPDRWVFLHGCADAHDLWFPLERQDFHSSPAMRLTGERAMEMAGIGVADIAAFDLYSCFPSAVAIGAESLGLALDDPRGFTVTGGLPYFGGPGNNYAMHGVATMMQRLRDKPGAFGMCTANGWYLTKQSVGVYSTKPFEGRWERQDPAVLQRRINALAHPEIVETPQGRATVETYTVVHTRDGYRMGIVVGRDAAGRRFVANTPNDEASLRAFESSEQVGTVGIVRRHEDGRRNLFLPD
ncbi:MAG TPA: acetyl-CoA acetyltransferase [Caulobacteraceae bacterium]|nr:acetyl-CoA acetyltransferase [Caulobacteraceae bacterium]